MNSSVFWIICRVVVCLCIVFFRMLLSRGNWSLQTETSTTLSMILHLVYTCYHLHLLNHRLLVLHPNEHVGNLDLLQELQELFLRILHDSWTVCTARRERASTSHDQTALRDLHDLDGGPSTRVSDVASATPEEIKTHHLILCASWESDLRDCGTVFNHRSAAMSEFGLIFERCCVAVTSYPQPPLRRGRGCTMGILTRTHPCDASIQAR